MGVRMADGDESDWQTDVLDQYRAGQAIAAAPFRKIGVFVKRIFASGIYLLIFLIFVAAFLFTTWQTVISASGSFQQNLFLGLTGGAVAFLVSPIIFFLMARLRWVFGIVLVGIVAGLLVAANQSEGLAQAAFLQAGITLGLILLVDIAFQGSLKAVSAWLKEIAEENRQIESNVDDAERELAPKHAAIGGGQIDEALALKKVQEFLSACEIAAAGAPVTEADRSLLRKFEAFRGLKVYEIDRLLSIAKGEYEKV